MDLTAPARLIVFNPKGRDPAQDFPGGAGDPLDASAPHPPVNFHGYAACVRGQFRTRLSDVLESEGAPVLLLLRRDLREGLRCLRALRKAGRVVAVTFKETGTAQVADQLSRPEALRLFLEILKLAGGCLAPTPWLVDFYRGMARLAGQEQDWAISRIEMIPTPYPIDDPRWNFSRPIAGRRGIFIGTRESATPSRQHLAAILAGCQLSVATDQYPVTVINSEGNRGAKWLATLGFSTAPESPRRMLDGPLPYTGYLRMMARHRLVFQLDRSGVPGQVAGDALLCRVPCAGGDGAIEQLVSPALAGHNKSVTLLCAMADTLLRDPAVNERAFQECAALAMKTVSFTAVSERLTSFFASLDEPGR